MKLLLKTLKCSALLAPFIFCGNVHADVKLASIFTDNMVLQRNQSVPIWGTADANETVTVKLGNGNTVRTIADADGKWMVKLAPQSAATSLILSVSGKNALSLQNVAVGEVWLCSGQSNMEMSVAASSNAPAEIAAAANFPAIRLLSVTKNAATTPQSELKGKWDVCTPESVKDFSAIAYFFGRELNQKLDVPIGLIDSTWGGTVAETWTSRQALQAVPALTTLVDSGDAEIKIETNAYVAALEKYQKETLPAWEIAAKTATDAGQNAPAKPDAPQFSTHPNRASNLFNGMIAPVIPYGIKGVLWYQGESNAFRPEEYRTLFPTLIRDWRARFGQGDFPFYWVQLANFQAAQKEAVEFGGWPMLREAQTRTLALPRTGQALAIDLADKDNFNEIHPRNKLDVGKRLALLAFNREYSQKMTDSGPMFSEMTIEKNRARISFQNAEGLSARGDKLQGFAISGADGIWKWADATIDGNQVVLSNAEVSAPVAVRYSWATNPIGNLYNGANLPAVPFRTDTNSAR